MSKVVNLRGMPLYPVAENKLAVTTETADGKPQRFHAEWVICALCKGHGKVIFNNLPNDIRACHDCNAMGMLLRVVYLGWPAVGPKSPSTPA